MICANPNCGNEFSSDMKRKKFCSHECYLVMNKTRANRRAQKIKEGVKLYPCHQCGKPKLVSAKFARCEKCKEKNRNDGIDFNMGLYILEI